MENNISNQIEALGTGGYFPLGGYSGDEVGYLDWAGSYFGDQGI